RLLLRGLARGEAVGPRVHRGNGNLLAVLGSRVCQRSHREERPGTQNGHGAAAEPDRQPTADEYFHDGPLFYRRLAARAPMSGSPVDALAAHPDPGGAAAAGAPAAPIDPVSRAVEGPPRPAGKPFEVS